MTCNPLLCRPSASVASKTILLLLSTLPSLAFVLPRDHIHAINDHNRMQPLLSSSPSHSDESVVGVVAPLMYRGPYACLGLNFPHMQQQPGYSINFVLDTGANVNTIRKDLADSLGLPVLLCKEDLSVLGSSGVGGSFQAGDIVLLGDCKLSGLPESQSNFTFMTNLTAAALDLGTDVNIGNGLLGTNFFECFPAGVEFDWYGTDGDPPTVIFYYGKEIPPQAKEGAFCVPLEKDSFFGVPTVNVTINGVELKAIVDTGSPITIISPDAANGNGWGMSQKNPSLKVKGIDKGIVDLAISSDKVSLAFGNESLGELDAIFIGDLPGISFAGSFANSTQPQVLLGLDALRRSYRMILRLPEKEVWFESLQESKTE
mmetsp:Transcript_2412/g.5581  ORF Transcript_2412/g.5581 Transcript_2412/m.5581 type:complete len:373 (+) Transcript_2412:415-1533(+)